MKVKPDIINGFIDSNLRDRILVFPDRCTAELTRDRVIKWQELGAFVVANAGAYDVLGLNHIRGLIQARIIGAAYRIGSLEDLNAVYDLAVSDEIRLLVSLDTNEAIEENKSFKKENGGSARPLLDWETRAKMLALQAISGKHDLVDFITKHGPSACNFCDNESCCHSYKTYNIASSGADLTIIKSPNQVAFSRHPSSRFHVINENDGAFFDNVLDSQISTTALVKRARKDKVAR